MLKYCIMPVKNDGIKISSLPNKKNIITIKTAGGMESKMAEIVGGLMKKYSNSFRFAFLPHFNGVSFRISKLGEGGDLQSVKNEFYQAMPDQYKAAMIDA